MLSNLKGKRLYSILNSKCPRCHEGDFHLTNNPYDLKNFGKNHEKCSECEYRFEKEPGFFYGAMYVSYGLNIALGVGMFILMVLVLHLDLLVYLFSFFGLVLILFPWIMRISRLTYINLFVKFDSSKK